MWRTARPVLRGAACAFLVASLAGCTPLWLSTLERDHALVGRIWDAREQGFIDEPALARRAAESRLVILGETHDNADHHRLQTAILAGMLRAGRKPALAMEQFDREHQQALDAARAGGERDPDALADAGRLDRRGWRWPDYRPLVALAAEQGLPLVAANLSREQARALMRSLAAGTRPPGGLAAADADMQAVLERDIVDGHCGMTLPPAMLKGMVEAQRARDAQLAASIQTATADGAVLITGAGHARRDRGAPVYLSAEARRSLLVIAFIEVENGRTGPREYAGADQFDLLWFTPRADREDPCAPFRRKG